MSEKVKQLLIIETAPAVSIQKDNNGNYVFEGIFGEIGVKNKNGRIYDESEYIPQIDLLQEKIKSGTLLGELDHPEKFDVSLSKASHVIESLSYDKDSKKVMGRIRLLNTTSGKEAQALAEGGVPLHISSRAAGVVESNGHVRIKRLFTYDLVADPGFANAQLNRVNEQYGITNNENIHIFEVDEFCNDDTYNKENSSIIMENDNIEFVKINDFEKWSKYISKELTELKTNIHENKNSENNNDISESINTKVNDLLEYVNYLANNVNNLISHNDYIAENVDKVILHLNHVAENANNGINYSEYQGAELEKAIKYIEHVAKGTNQIKEYVDYLGSSTNKIAQYTDYLGEGMNKHVNYTDYLKNNIETVGNYSNHIGEKFNKFTTNSPIISNKVEENKDTQIPENIVKSEIKTGNDYKKDITEKLSAILESAKKQTAEGNLHFLRFLPKEKQDSFYELDTEKQTSVVKAFEGKTYFNSQQVEEIYESGLNLTPENQTFGFIKNMPNEYTEAWEKLSEARKKQIVAESKYHNLDTQYQINNFWQTRDLRDSAVILEKVENSPITEKNTSISDDSANFIINKVRELRGLN